MKIILHFCQIPLNRTHWVFRAEIHNFSMIPPSSISLCYSYCRAVLATWLPQAAWLLSKVKPTVGNPAGSRNPNLGDIVRGLHQSECPSVNSCFSLVSVTLPLHFLRLLSHC